MKIFIDFDDVIFNTKQFKEDLAQIFFQHGISRELYEQTYHDPNDNKIVRTYDPYSQIERLKKVTAFDEQKILSAVKKFLNNGSQYVFPDVRKIVLQLGQDSVFVLSYGEVAFQKEKIDSSHISEYITHVFITNDMKANMLEHIFREMQISQEEPTYFLDDRVEQIHSVKEKFPHIITMLVKRPEGRYQEMEKEQCCNFQVCNLAEAEKIIKRQ